VVCLVPSVSTNELNSSKTRASEEPAPKVVEEQASGGEGIEDQQEAHELMLFLVDIMVPDADD